MKLQSLWIPAALMPCALAFPYLMDFPRHRSLAGLSDEEVQFVMQEYRHFPGAQPLPPPISYTGPKLINDREHPFEELRPGDIRGPCPGLNTLASHGYLNRNGVVTPGEIITAIQEGFNLGYHFATFLTYTGFVVNGNHLTNMITIGSNTTVDYQHITGIDTHGNFEGDGSITRQDIFFGDPINLSKREFDTLVYAANKVGGGAITVEAAGFDRGLRINDSIARNPGFEYRTPRYSTAVTESTFQLAFFHSNQTADNTEALTLEEARHFFDIHKFPDGFHRRQAPFDFAGIEALVARLIDIFHTQPGHNEGVNNYVLDPTDNHTPCLLYTRQVGRVTRLYPKPRGALRRAIKTNLKTYYQTVNDPSCTELFPYGK